jgi:hypothetical protein
MSVGRIELPSFDFQSNDLPLNYTYKLTNKKILYYLYLLLNQPIKVFFISFVISAVALVTFSISPIELFKSLNKISPGA